MRNLPVIKYFPSLLNFVIITWLSICVGNTPRETMVAFDIMFVSTMIGARMTAIRKYDGRVGRF